MTPGEEGFKKVMRWMHTNVTLACAIYRSKDGRLALDPFLDLEPDGSIVRRTHPLQEPGDVAGWMLASGAALMSVCYIAALGKVVSGGRLETHCDRALFTSFLTTHMTDFVEESEEHDFRLAEYKVPPRHASHNFNGRTCDLDGGNRGTEVLYRIFRNGLVHQFAPTDGGWSRATIERDYWLNRPKPALNVDRVALGFLEALESFRRTFVKRVELGEVTYDNFYAWLTIERTRSRRTRGGSTPGRTQ